MDKKMSTLELVNIIINKKLRIFTTADFIMLTQMKKSAACKALERLSKKKIIARLKRGVWVSQLAKDILPAEALPYLTLPWPSYVSLESALSEYGIISQIPTACHGITLGKPLRLKTPLGEFRIHHLQKSLFGEYQMKRVGSSIYFIASPEKALLDTLYLRYRLGAKPNIKEWDLSSINRARLKKLAKPYPLSVKHFIHSFNRKKF